MLAALVTSHGMMIAGAREHVVLPALRSVHERLVKLAHAHAEQPMLSRTHGQPASPTTLGKEMAKGVDKEDERAKFDPATRALIERAGV